MKRLSIGQRVVMLLAALLLVILIINIPDNNGQPSNNDSLILSKESKSVDSEQSADGFSGTETVRILSTGEMQKSMEKNPVVQFAMEKYVNMIILRPMMKVRMPFIFL